MDILNSLHNAIRSAFASAGADSDWSREKTKSLYKALDPEQQKLVRELAQSAANSTQRAEKLEAVVSELSSSLARVSSNDSAQIAAKDAEISKLREELAKLSGQIQSLAQSSGVTEEPKVAPPTLPKTAIVSASRRELVKTPHGKLVEETTRQFVMIQEFVQSVRADSTLLETLRSELKTGKTLNKAEQSIMKKTVVANIENWLIEKKRPHDMSVDQWKKLVRDSIADPQNQSLFQYDLPNLNHFIEIQVMKVRDLLFPKTK